MKHCAAVRIVFAPSLILVVLLFTILHPRSLVRSVNTSFVPSISYNGKRMGLELAGNQNQNAISRPRHKMENCFPKQMCGRMPTEQGQKWNHIIELEHEHPQLTTTCTQNGEKHVVAAVVFVLEIIIATCEFGYQLSQPDNGNPAQRLDISRPKMLFILSESKLNT